MTTKSLKLLASFPCCCYEPTHTLFLLLFSFHHNSDRYGRGLGYTMLSSGSGRAVLHHSSSLLEQITQRFNGKHVAFEQVGDGMELVNVIEKGGSANQRTTTTLVTVVNCEQLYHHHLSKTPQPTILWSIRSWFVFHVREWVLYF